MTLAAQLARYFEARPNVWIDARAFLDVAGFAAWRSRISDLRRAPFSMQIDNRTRRETFMGRTFTVSEYRFVPHVDLRDAPADNQVITA